MPGTQAGGRKAVATIKLLYGSDFYQRTGARGGVKGRTGGFASKKVGVDGLTGQDRARMAGKKGGATPRRRKKTHLALPKV